MFVQASYLGANWEITSCPWHIQPCPLQPNTPQVEQDKPMLLWPRPVNHCLNCIMITLWRMVAKPSVSIYSYNKRSLTNLRFKLETLRHNSRQKPWHSLVAPWHWPSILPHEHTPRLRHPQSSAGAEYALIFCEHYLNFKANTSISSIFFSVTGGRLRTIKATSSSLAFQSL